MLKTIDNSELSQILEFCPMGMALSNNENKIIILIFLQVILMVMTSMNYPTSYSLFSHRAVPFTSLQTMSMMISGICAVRKK